MRKPIFFLCFFFLTIHLFSQHPKREMRAVWIATVSNIDWPSSQRLSTSEQRKEMIKLLDGFAKNNINAVVVQIRPTADAFYSSPHEPWSHWLTGKQGSRPVPYYDPLQFIIEEAHKRFIEVHAWINPYRVTNSRGSGELCQQHLFFEKKEMFVNYGNRYYFDPGLDETREFLNLVVRDVVERYNIDAVHFDDYFYPYKIAGVDFPDQKTFERYPRGFTQEQKNDWRRNNVNLIISELQQTIKSIKPWVEFGISPFGVWRNSSTDPRGSATKAGIQNYDDLYADILKWLQEGSIDYVTPQLYWEIGKSTADYETLVNWWSENSYGKNLYIGLGVYKMEDKSQAKAWNNGNEIVRQLNVNKKHPQVDGVMYYNATAFLGNKRGLNDSLQHNYYKYPAICPINHNIKGEAAVSPQKVSILKDGANTFLFWDKVAEKNSAENAYYIVYAFKGKTAGDLNNPANILVRTHDNYINLKRFKHLDLTGNYTFVVTSVNRYKQESVPTHAVTRKL